MITLLNTLMEMSDRQVKGKQGDFFYRPRMLADHTLSFWGSES